MSFSIGIVGLPNVGKSTLFKALTKKKVEIAVFPFTTISPNIGIVSVPDERLEKIAKIANFEKLTKTFIKFIDIAGLVKNAHKGEGLGNQFLSHINECDGILEIVRCFEDPKIEHIEKQIDPQRDIKIVENELIMKDSIVLENAIVSLEKKEKSRERESLKKLTLLKEIKGGLLEEKKISDLNLTEEEKDLIREFQFLTIKPVVYVLNVKGEKEIKIEGFTPLEVNEPKKEHKESKPLTGFTPSILLDLKTEEEISEMTPADLRDLNLKSSLDQLILACYNSLDLITFYTICGLKEARAWTLKKGKSVLEAAEKVHSDFKENFIKAEVINWEKLVETGSWNKAKEMGLIQTAGKEYEVKNGEVIEFKI